MISQNIMPSNGKYMIMNKKFKFKFIDKISTEIYMIMNKILNLNL